MVTRTPTQVASHAQTYFLCRDNLHRRHRRSSLFDITTDSVAATPTLPPSSVIDTRPVVLQEHLPPPEISDTDGFPSSSEVASHAQKYFVRQNNLQRRRHLSCPFDITIDTVAATPTLRPWSVIDTRPVLLQEHLPPPEISDPAPEVSDALMDFQRHLSGRLSNAAAD